MLLALTFLVVFFHITEFLVSKHYHPETTTADSFLVTIPFLFAFSFGIAEFLIEYCIFTPVKTHYTDPTMLFGLFLILFGLYIRITALLTAQKSFTHHIAYEKVESHKIITHGIYSIERHPGYLGMFIFSIGSQVFLKNPIATVVFAAVLWKFFRDRIQEEEEALLQIFGRDYLNYRSKTRTWIPFIE